MVQNRIRCVVIAGLSALAPARALAIDFHESTLPSGDFSNLASAPDPLAFSVGSNLVIGSVVGGTDRPDFIRFTVAPGQQLVALRLASYIPDNLGFHALTPGAQSFDPSTASPPAGVTTWAGNHVGTETDGTDLLPTFNPGATITGPGLSTPLGPGTYSYVMQQTGSPAVSYRMEFVVSGPSNVPALGAWAVTAAAGLLGVGAHVARRRTRSSISPVVVQPNKRRSSLEGC